MFVFIRFLLVVLLCITSKLLYAQQPYFLSVNRQNGMPSDVVYDVHQDKQGFMWFATESGLCRYNGVDFVSYRVDKQSSVSGSSIKEDRYGRIWYENFDGFLYYVDSGKLKYFKPHASYFFTPFSISDSFLFACNKNSVDVYDITTLKIVKTINLPTDMLINSVGMNGVFFVVTETNVFKIDEKLRLSSVNLPVRLDGVIWNVCVSADRLFLTSRSNIDEHIYVYDKDLRLKHIHKIDHPGLIQTMALVGEDLYLNTPVGSIAMHNFTYSNGTLHKYFKGKSISQVYIDRQNNYWFSSTGEGVFILPNINNIIYDFSGYVPSRMELGKDGFYIGTKNGVLLKAGYDLRNAVQVHKTNGDGAIYNLYSDVDNVVYSSSGVTFLPGHNPIKAINMGLALKDIVRVDEKYYAYASSGSCGLLINKIATDKTSEWDAYFEANKDKVEKNVAFFLNFTNARSVAYAANVRRVFMATNKGLLSLGVDSAVEFAHNGERVYVSKLYVYENKLFLLNTMGRVCSVSFSDDGKHATEWTELPLQDVVIMKRFEDNLYFVSNATIYSLSLSGGLLQKLNLDIGLEGVNDIYKADSMLYIVKNTGIISVQLNKTIIERKKATLHIDGVFVNNELVGESTIESLPFYKKNIAISFSVLDFGVTHAESLFYKLNNDLWKEVPHNSRLLQFPSLSAGEYNITFRLGDDRIVKTISFSIKPAFWQQWWFYLSCLLLLSGAVMVYYRWQIRVRIKKLEVQKEKMQLEQDLGKSKLTSIRAQMNPHFFYNALNTIQAYIFMNDKAKASSYLAKFSRLTRIILQMSEAETVSLTEETETMKLYLELEKMRFDSGFDYDIQYVGIENKESIEIPSMIIQPYVENAIKHGLLHKVGDKRLLVVFEQVGKQLLVTIDDNGIGRKRSGELNKIKADKYRSFSTSANEKRLELLNKGKIEKIVVNTIDKTNSKGLPTGTTITLSIPL